MVKYETVLGQLCTWARAYEQLKVLKPKGLYKIEYLDGTWEIIRPKDYTSTRMAYYVLAANTASSQTLHKEDQCFALPLLNLGNLKISEVYKKDLPLYTSAPYTSPLLARILRGEKRVTGRGTIWRVR